MDGPFRVSPLVHNAIDSYARAQNYSLGDGVTAAVVHLFYDEILAFPAALQYYGAPRQYEAYCTLFQNLDLVFANTAKAQIRRARKHITLSLFRSI